MLVNASNLTYILYISQTRFLFALISERRCGSDKSCTPVESRHGDCIVSYATLILARHPATPTGWGQSVGMWVLWLARHPATPTEWGQSVGMWVLWLPSNPSFSPPLFPLPSTSRFGFIMQTDRENQTRIIAHATTVCVSNRTCVNCEVQKCRW